MMSINSYVMSEPRLVEEKKSRVWMAPTVGPRYPLNHPVDSDAHMVSLLLKAGPMLSSEREENTKATLTEGCFWDRQNCMKQVSTNPETTR